VYCCQEHVESGVELKRHLRRAPCRLALGVATTTARLFCTLRPHTRGASQLWGAHRCRRAPRAARGRRRFLRRCRRLRCRRPALYPPCALCAAC
jgi:hypothetical protein